MTQHHEDTGDLVARLRNNHTVHIELAAICKTYGLNAESIAGVISASETDIEAAARIETHQAEIERLNHDAEVVECAVDGYERGNEFEGKSVDVCIGIIGQRAEKAERVVEAMRCIVTGKVPFDKALKPGVTMNWEGLLRAVQNHASDALTAYDKETDR